MFDEKVYTEDSVIKTLLLIQNHASDGSAKDSGCTCIQDKHLFVLEGLGEEGSTIMSSEKEKRFYADLAELARELRKSIDTATYEMPSNPLGRKYQPHGLTDCEKSHPDVLHSLTACIKEVEEKEGCRPPYTDCRVNPVAVCRASIKCP